MTDQFRRRVVISGFLSLAAFARDVRAQDSIITVLDYHVSIPTGWTRVTPASSSRLAQFVVGPDSANRTEVVVFFFGQAQGGNVEANLARWKGQFSNPDGSPVSEKVTRDSSGTFPITIAEYRGSYRRGIGAGSADSVRTGQALVAAIVETPRGALFIQLFGPGGRVTAERERLIAFVRQIK